MSVALLFRSLLDTLQFGHNDHVVVIGCMGMVPACIPKPYVPSKGCIYADAAAVSLSLSENISGQVSESLRARIPGSARVESGPSAPNCRRASLASRVMVLFLLRNAGSVQFVKLCTVILVSADSKSVRQ